MKNLPKTESYPGFNYPVEQLAKFIRAADVYTILLKNKAIVHFEPDESDHFYQWLQMSNVEDIRENLL